MVRIASWAGALGLVIFGGSAISAEPLIRAVVVDGHAYVSPIANVFADEPSWKEKGTHFTLLGRELAGRGQFVTLRHPEVVDGQQYRQVLHRWQVDRKRVHFLHYDNWETSGLQPFERNILLVSSPLELVKSLKAPIPSTGESDVRRQEFDRTRTGHDAGPPGWNREVAWRVTTFNNDRVSFDFLSAADDQYEWYVSEPDGEGNRITRWDTKPPRKKGDQNKWAEVGVWTTDFGGRFFAVSGGDDRYFVTDTGRVFAAPQKAKAGTPLKEIWKGKPVEALIHDADNAKWYAFTKDQYFEVADPIKPVAHALTTKRSLIAEEALVMAAKCGRVIRGIPEPKDK